MQKREEDTDLNHVMKYSMPFVFPMNPITLLHFYIRILLLSTVLMRDPKIYHTTATSH